MGIEQRDAHPARRMVLGLLAAVASGVVATRARSDRDQARPRRRARLAFRQSAGEFAKRANAKLAGKAKIIVYGSSQLGGDKEMIQKLKLGTLDMALPSTVMSTEVDLFGIFEMPYIVKSRDHRSRARLLARPSGK